MPGDAGKPSTIGLSEEKFVDVPNRRIQPHAAGERRRLLEVVKDQESCTVLRSSSALAGVSQKCWPTFLDGNDPRTAECLYPEEAAAIQQAAKRLKNGDLPIALRNDDESVLWYEHGPEDYSDSGALFYGLVPSLWLLASPLMPLPYRRFFFRVHFICLVGWLTQLRQKRGTE